MRNLGLLLCSFLRWKNTPCVVSMLAMTAQMVTFVISIFIINMHATELTVISTSSVTFAKYLFLSKVDCRNLYVYYKSRETFTYPGVLLELTKSTILANFYSIFAVNFITTLLLQNCMPFNTLFVGSAHIGHLDGCINSTKHSDVMWRHIINWTLFWLPVTCHLFGDSP